MNSNRSKLATVFSATATGLFVLAIVMMLTDVIYQFVVKDIQIAQDELGDLSIGGFALVLAPSVIGLVGALWLYARLSRNA